MIALGILMVGIVVAGCASTTNKTTTSTGTTRSRRMSGVTQTKFLEVSPWKIIAMKGSTGLDRVTSPTSPTLTFEIDKSI